MTCVTGFDGDVSSKSKNLTLRIADFLTKSSFPNPSHDRVHVCWVIVPYKYQLGIMNPSRAKKDVTLALKFIGWSTPSYGYNHHRP